MKSCDYDYLSEKEFLIADGWSYASSSLAGNTRKYHGLLVKNDQVLLSAVDDFVEGKRLSCFRYRKCVVDEALRYLQAYVHPARFVYWIDGVVEKRVELNDGEVKIVYELDSPKKIELIPLFAMRSIHSVRKDFEDVNVKLADSSLEVTSSESEVKIDVIADSADVKIDKVDYVYYDAFYSKDCERGYECCENLYAPVKIEALASKLELIAYTEKRVNTSKAYSYFTTPERILERACDAFLKDGLIVAGYHWFVEPWGRDTFVSLPGLLLERGKFGIARNVFLYFARRMKNGVIPNRIAREITYNSSDASLWFVHALKAYVSKTGDKEFLYRIKVYLEELFDSYPCSDVAELKGNLIYVKPRTTWMDTAYTPREGFAVEVNALWIEALAFAEELKIDTDWEGAFREFLKKFWNGSYLNDTADDSSVRPNQVIAMAVLTSLVKDEELTEKAKKVCSVVEEKLLTPYGLRTLSPDHPDYRGRFCGDESYHNGCVWPWLTGFYAELKKNVSGEFSRKLLIPLLSHLYDSGLGFISEIFDGDAPHRPNGCIAQAWSVAEVYRALRIAGF